MTNCSPCWSGSWPRGPWHTTGRTRPGPVADQDADRASLPQELHRAGVAALLKRHGWSCQVPARRAVERTRPRWPAG
ncbi:winged helix-turn-helix domain-containing protein [Streptomyces wuyuanensis]|uniref:winged helix-turn-helix domain-containing protein n=1 Tax=Streptomyces wuyuanensis TaxID=1196353 RepID=UPI003432A47C